MNTKEQELKVCAVCSKPADKKCSGCSRVFYCSVEHQKQDWKSHRGQCQLHFEIKDVVGTNVVNSFTGKYCEATTDIKEGQIILDEAPLYQRRISPINCCVTCGVDREALGCLNKKCSRCLQPVCSTECEKLPIHTDNECMVFGAQKLFGIPPLQFDMVGIDAVDYYRFMCAKDYNPKLWSRLTSMMMDWNKKDGDEKMESMESDDMGMDMYRRLHEFCKLHGYFYCLTEDQFLDKTVFRMGSYVYEKAAHFTHSCVPNCDWVVGNFPDFKIRIRAAVPIKKGETLTVSRFEFEDHNRGLCGTIKRQEAFLKTFPVPCQCAFCIDPTEFGTYQSAIACSICRKEKGDNGQGQDDNVGYLLPIDPTRLALDKDPWWRCNRCDVVKRFSSINQDYNKILNFILGQGRLAHDNPFGLRSSTTGQVCEDLLKKYGGKDSVLHPNHWLLQKLVRYVRVHYVTAEKHKTADPLSNPSLLDPLKLMKFQLELMNVTQPGLLRTRVLFICTMCDFMEINVDRILGKYNKKLGPAINQMTKKNNVSPFSSFGPEEDEELKKLRADLLSIIEMRTDALRYFKRSPPQRGKKESSCVVLMKNSLKQYGQVLTYIEYIINERSEVKKNK